MWNRQSLDYLIFPSSDSFEAKGHGGCIYSIPIVYHNFLQISSGIIYQISDTIAFGVIITSFRMVGNIL